MSATRQPRPARRPRLSAADIMRVALLRIAATTPSASGMDAADRLAAFRRAFEDVQRIVRDGLSGAARAACEDSDEVWSRLYRILDAGDRGEALAWQRAETAGFARGVRAAAAEHTDLAIFAEREARHVRAEGFAGTAEEHQAMAKQHRDHAAHILTLLPAGDPPA